MGKYITEEISSGWAIFYIDYFEKNSFIAGHLTRKQADKWCKRLNEAYSSGYANGSY